MPRSRPPDQAVPLPPVLAQECNKPRPVPRQTNIPQSPLAADAATSSRCQTKSVSAATVIPPIPPTPPSSQPSDSSPSTPATQLSSSRPPQLPPSTLRPS